MAERAEIEEDGDDALEAFLSNPASYGNAHARIEMIETHAARVFLVGSRAYKVKKPVTLPFLDFSTVDARRHALSREFELNRKHAPEIYVALGSINRDASGALTFDEGEPVEPVLVMNRFDQNDLLARIADRGPLTRKMALELAHMIARYHRTLDPRAARGGGAAIMKDTVAELADELENAAPPSERQLTKPVADQLRKAVERISPLLDLRAEAGYVRRCHGDLHLGNIVVIGRPIPFDALEFDEKLATIDVFYDLAFLLMDLDVRSQRPAANAVLNAYVALEPTRGEIQGLEALPLFLATRAAVRGVVALERARQEHDDADRARDLARAMEYVKAVAWYLAPPPPRLVAVGGLSGTGKSTLAAALAPRIGAAPGALVLRTDVERKLMFGVQETDRLSRGHYGDEISAQVYARLYYKARRALEAGHAVIFDGVSSKPAERDAIAAVAQEAGVPFNGLWLEAPVEVQMVRVGARRNDASDSNEAVVREQATRDLGPITWTRIDAGRAPAETLRQAEAALALDLPTR